MKPMTRSATFALLATAACLAHATEGGGSTYPRGVENFLVGAVPPPGVYLLGYGNHYAADKFITGQGDNAGIPGFKVRATAAVLRGVWSTTTEVMGGHLVFHSIVPLVNLKVSAAGNSQSKSGVGDITLGTGVAFHHSPQLHTVVGLDFSLPTGDYDKNNLANIGRNYLSVQPLFGVSHIDPNGLNADLKLTLNLNRRNKDTDYRSGNELFADYSIGWGVGNGWTVGVGGHAWQQLTNDKSGGADVANSKTRAFALGPSLKYDDGKGWFFTAKLQRDMAVRNSTQGTAFWLKTSIPF